MSNLKLNTTLRNARLDAITTFAGANAIWRIYQGTQPSGGGAAGTLLAQITGPATFAAGAANGVLTLNGPLSTSSANTGGTAQWFRVWKSDGTTWVMDGDVSTQAAGTGDLQLDNTTIVLGGTVALGGPNTVTDSNAA